MESGGAKAKSSAAKIEVENTCENSFPFHVTTENPRKCKNIFILVTGHGIQEGYKILTWTLLRRKPRVRLFGTELNCPPPRMPHTNTNYTKIFVAKIAAHKSITAAFSKPLNVSSTVTGLRILP